MNLLLEGSWHTLELTVDRGSGGIIASYYWRRTSPHAGHQSLGPNVFTARSHTTKGSAIETHTKTESGELLVDPSPFGFCRVTRSCRIQCFGISSHTIIVCTHVIGIIITHITLWSIYVLVCCSIAVLVHSFSWPVDTLTTVYVSWFPSSVRFLWEVYKLILVRTITLSFRVSY